MLPVANNTLITGGHFLLTEDGSSINLGTIRSFREAANLYAAHKHIASNLALGILINDIGAVCGSASANSSCSLAPTTSKANFSLPVEYQNILSEYGLHIEELAIFWEKHMRNRGKKLLLKELAKQNQHIHSYQGGYIYSNPQEKIEILLTRASRHDPHGTPACPLIMGAYAIEAYQMGFSSSINFYYVNENNYKNVANHFVIEKGKYVALQFMSKLNIKNIYLFEDQILCNFTS